MKSKTLLVSMAIIGSLTLLFSGCGKKTIDEETTRAMELEQKIVAFNLANYTKDGGKKWELKGESADILAEIIYLENILVNNYQDPPSKLTSDEGQYNRKDKTVLLTKNVLLTTDDGFSLTTDSINWDGNTDFISTEDYVEVKRADVFATGTGAEAISEVKHVKLLKDVTVILLKDAMSGGALDELKSAEDESEDTSTTITCDGVLDIDYENNIAVFNDNVKVDDKRGQIYSEIMSAYLDPVSKNIVKVIAEEGVRVVRGKDSTFSDRAIYTTADQKIVLLGKPKIYIQADKEIEKIDKHTRR